MDTAVDDEHSWRKASYSGPDGGNCVEVGQNPGSVLVRDTTDRQGPALGFSADTWKDFAARLRSGTISS